MKRLVAAGMIAGLLHSVSVMASPTPWENMQDLYTIVGWKTTPEFYTFEWFQMYDGSPDPIHWAKLTIVADDVDNVHPTTGNAEDDMIAYRLASGDPWTTLGPLVRLASYTSTAPTAGAGPAEQQTTTVFTLPDAGLWLAGASGFYARLVVEDWWNMEIETAALSVEREGPAAIPAPSALLLGLLGLGGLGVKSHRRLRL